MKKQAYKTATFHEAQSGEKNHKQIRLPLIENTHRRRCELHFTLRTHPHAHKHSYTYTASYNNYLCVLLRCGVSVTGNKHYLYSK